MDKQMITLYSYPQMFSLPDNNPFGLKVDTFLRLTGLDYKQEHILNTQEAPRGQLPYLRDNDRVISDSNTIINYLITTYSIPIDNELTESQKNLHFLVTRMLDNHLYWVMSYSRWQDEHYWPLFKAEFLRQCPHFSIELMEKARSNNMEKYYYQGIGRCNPADIYQAGIDNLKSINLLLGTHDFFFGSKIHSIDACCYGFLANILFFDIDTPLKKFILDTPSLAEYTKRIRKLLHY